MPLPPKTNLLSELSPKLLEPHNAHSPCIGLGAPGPEPLELCPSTATPPVSFLVHRPHSNQAALDAEAASSVWIRWPSQCHPHPLPMNKVIHRHGHCFWIRYDFICPISEGCRKSLHGNLVYYHSRGSPHWCLSDNEGGKFKTLE